MGPFQCKDAKLCKPPSSREGNSIQFTSTKLLQEHTSQEGFKAHAKRAKELRLGAELTPLKHTNPPKPGKRKVHAALEKGQLRCMRVSQTEPTSKGGGHTAR